MNHLLDFYANYRVPLISCATVRDYCDSFDHLTDLASSSLDLKDVQRPWTIKAIIGNVPRGASLLEIGAGEPVVAAILAGLGYRVTVVDPYDGSGNGPTEFEAFKQRFPGVRIVRGQLVENLPDLVAHSFDCIYSISVLEHIPIPAVPQLCSAIRRFLVPKTGKSIHSIDHVLKGPGDAHHLERLLLLADLLGFSRTQLKRTLQAAADDVETYFLSAESHNRWRGKTVYENFPMRRVVSLQINVPA